MLNFRDFGYKNVKKGLLFRSASLSELSPEDQNMLMENNIRTIVDLRGLDERTAKPDTQISGIENLSIPLSVIGSAKPTIYRGLRLPNLIDCYHQLVAIDLKETWSRIFDLLLNSDDGVLFHCSQGKDRAGLLAYVLEIALGVSKEDVKADYLRSNVAMKVRIAYHMDELKNEPFYDEQYEKSLIDVFSAKEEYLDHAISEVEKKYESMENYITKALCVDVEKLRALYIE